MTQPGDAARPGDGEGRNRTGDTTIFRGTRWTASGAESPIEGFWSNTKRGIAGTYHSVSKKWLQSYLNEYAWRYNERAMFDSLVGRSAA
jgi:hypothetical protein